MPYAVTQDAIDLYGDTLVLTSVSREDSPDAAPLDNALAKASDEMDTYLGVQYDVPLATVPDVVERFCVDIGIYIASFDAGTLTEEKIERYKAAIAWCKEVARGSAVLPSVGAESSLTEHAPQVSSETRIFSRTKMGWLL